MSHLLSRNTCAAAPIVRGRSTKGSAAAVAPGDGHVRRLGALLALARLELDLVVLGEALEAFAGDVAVMNEEILPAVLRRDEPVTLRIVKPLNGSGCHYFHLLLPLTNGREAQRPPVLVLVVGDIVEGLGRS
jgi:hypothetical protein